MWVPEGVQSLREGGGVGKGAALEYHDARMQKRRRTAVSGNRETLRGSGLKATAARVAVLDALRRAAAPLSVRRALAAIPKGLADQATVYRILEVLEERGLVRPVDLRHGHKHYELASLPHHHHLICTGCGRTEDVAACDADRLARLAQRHSRHFAVVTQHALEFFGLCRRCARQKA